MSTQVASCKLIYVTIMIAVFKNTLTTQQRQLGRTYGTWKYTHLNYTNNTTIIVYMHKGNPAVT